MTYYNPLDKFYKSQTGAVCANEKITFRVKGDFDSVVLLLKKDGRDYDQRLEMIKKRDYFELSYSFEVGLYFYCFELHDGRFIGRTKDYGGVITSLPERFQLTVYSRNYTVPKWIYGGVIYQIFPDRFCRGETEKNIDSDKILHEKWNEIPVFEPNEKGQVINNDFFGGDLKGIIQKLDYLDSLGITAIYLNPIFKAHSNHRYDTGDYMTIDPLLGNEEDLRTLIEKAEKKGIKIILDGVFNHTGDDSIYFNKYGKYDSLGAYQSRESKYFGWYKFIDYPNEYDAWWGIKVLPAVNENDVGFINYITGKNGVLDKYTRLGIGGWRLDVVDELPSRFVQKIRTAVKDANPDAIIIGEVWENASNKISYGVRREYFQGKELDSVMNYPLKDAVINFVKFGNAEELARVIYEQIDNYPQAVLHSLMNILSTHDTFRLLSAVSGLDVEGKSKKEMADLTIPRDMISSAKFNLKVASLLQFTLCGIPSIYYGDEIGMEGYTDPLNRRTYPWGKEDQEILSWYKFLGRLRKDYSAFICGEYKTIYAVGDTFVFKREDELTSIAIAVNIGKKTTTLSFEGSLTDLISGNTYLNEIILGGTSMVILVKK